MANEFKELCANIRTFTGDVVTQKRKNFEQQKMKGCGETQWEEVPRKRNSFLEQFMELSEAGEGHLTDTEIIDEVLAILVGGGETSAAIMAFTLIMLGMHPDIQEKLYREVIDAIGNDKPVEYTDLPNLPYTEMVIRETMRIFPVGSMFARSITGDIQLDEHTVIPAGSSVIIGVIHAQRNPDVWPNPLQFDPFRFSLEECAKRHPYNFLSFSGGLRNCIGQKFAMMAMKTVIATVVRKYQITKSVYEKIEDIKITQHIVLRPIDGYGIFIEARH